MPRINKCDFYHFFTDYYTTNVDKTRDYIIYFLKRNLLWNHYNNTEMYFSISWMTLMSSYTYTNNVVIFHLIANKSSIYDWVVISIIYMTIDLCP